MRWLALTLGILNPGESRLSAVAVFDSLIHFQFVEKRDASAAELMEYIGKNWEVMNEKTLRYHLLRMKRMGIVENAQGKFCLTPPGTGDRFDSHTWARSLYEKDFSEIALKIGDAIKEIKAKTAIGENV